MPTGYPSVPTTDLGARLRQRRIKARLSQEELAAKLNTQANRVSDWEIGKHVPTLPLLQRMAVVYRTSVSRLLKGVM
jgi:transcriptional regulator with XRE-family HTH domain